MEKYSRKDMLIEYGDNYLRSGIKGSLDTTSIKPGICPTQVIVKYDGKYYISNRY